MLMVETTLHGVRLRASDVGIWYRTYHALPSADPGIFVSHGIRETKAMSDDATVPTTFTPIDESNLLRSTMPPGTQSVQSDRSSSQVDSYRT
jgi:hypothetical protein